MNNEQFFKAIDGVDDELLKDALDPEFDYVQYPKVYRLEKRRGGWIMPALAGAACLAVIVGVAAAVRFGGKEQFTSDVEFPDGKPDWVNNGAAASGNSGSDTSDISDDDDYVRALQIHVNGGEYPPFIWLDGEDPFASSIYLPDYDEFNYGNLSNLPLDVPEDSEYDREKKPDEIFKYTFSSWLYFPTYYGVWEPLDTSVIGADYVEELGIEVPSFHSGEVVYAGAASKGNAVIIKHADDDYSLYGYLDELFVKVGDIVDKEQTIATTGGEGYNEYSWYNLAGEHITPYDCVLTLWHGVRAIDISEWNRYVDSRDGINCKNHVSGLYPDRYNYYLKKYNPEAVEANGEDTPAPSRTDCYPGALEDDAALE